MRINLNYKKVILCFLAFANIAISAYAKNNQEEVSSLNTRAIKESGSGNYAKAIEFLEKAISIEKKSVGENNIDIAILEHNIADNYLEIGNLTKSLASEEKALAIAEGILPPNSLEICRYLFNMGRIYFAAGNYVKALDYNDRALKIVEKSNDPERLAAALSNQANVYGKMGNYDKALPLAVKALALSEQTLGPDNPKITFKLSTLASIYENQGDYSKALSLRERALAIAEKSYGPNHPEIIAGLNNIAFSHSHEKKYDKALECYQRCLDICVKSFGSDHPTAGKIYTNIGRLYARSGDYPQSISFYEKALATTEKINGPDHPDTLNILGYLSALQYKNGVDLQTIRANLSKKWNGELKQLNSAISLDESTRLSWEHEHLNYNLIHLLRSEQIAQIVLKTKNVVLDSEIEDRAALKGVGHETPEFKELQEARLKLGKISLSNKKEDKEEVAKLNERINSIVSTISKSRTALGASRAASSITVDSVAATLPSGSLLIEFIQFVDSKDKEEKSGCYGAIVIGCDGETKFIRIEDAPSVNTAINSYKKSIETGDEKALIINQKTLFDKLWVPLAKFIPDGTKKIYIGPDGQLNFLSFSALTLPDGSFLAEHFDIAYVGSGRDLARGVSPSESKTVALFADPVFDRQSSAFTTNDLALRSGELAAFGQIVLSPLPGTRAEETIVEEAAKRAGWSPVARLGKAAKKSAIIDLKSPGILHLATHGFYLNTLPANGSDGERGMKVMESPDLSGNKPAPLPKIDPMHASGIALTGAQATLKAWSEGRVPNPSEDGILTADEVGALNLDGTWLVTLSACETGVGEARSGEGVFGLRRAFMTAGAQNLLMTLWPVSDEVTPKIMADFYKEALATHDAAGSLAKVQRDWLVKIRNEKGLLAAVRDAGPFAMVVMANPNLGKSSPVAQPSSSPSGATPVAPTPPDTSPSPSPTPVQATSESQQLKKAA